MDYYKIYFLQSKTYSQLLTKWEIAETLFNTYRVALPKQKIIKWIIANISFMDDEKQTKQSTFFKKQRFQIIKEFNTTFKDYSFNKQWRIVDIHNRIVSPHTIIEWLENYEPKEKNKQLRSFVNYRFRYDPVPHIHTKTFKSCKNMHCFNKTELAQQLFFPTRTKRRASLLNHDKWDVLKHPKSNWKQNTKHKKQWEKHFS
jgi:hypothetical protein